MILMKKLFLIFIFSIFSISPAFSLTEVQQEILKIVMSPNGTINKDIYNRFWSEMSSDEVKKIINKENYDTLIIQVMQKYQRELWKSALTSYEQKKIYKSENYSNAQKEAKDLILSITKNISDENLRNKAIVPLKVAMANSEELLSAAAEHREVKFAQGQAMKLDKNIIKLIINSMDKVFFRLEKLLNHKWQD
jgi:hypothetical protein